jgi:hypothetical protein
MAPSLLPSLPRSIRHLRKNLTAELPLPPRAFHPHPLPSVSWTYLKHKSSSGNLYVWSRKGGEGDMHELPRPFVITLHPPSLSLPSPPPI